MLNHLLLQPNKLVKKVYPKAVWQIKTKSPTIYLTFDDGPIPGLTEWVLDVLKEHSIKASFFCVGENIHKNPKIFKRILNEGHSVGNHTYNHIKGYKTKVVDYMKNVRKCESLTKTRLFRPPYGQLKPNQYRRLIKLGFKVVLWDVISYDYEEIPKKVCFKNVKNNAGPGSIILFHDNIKAEKNLKYALPKTIEHFLKLNYNFATL